MLLAVGAVYAVQTAHTFQRVKGDQWRLGVKAMDKEKGCNVWRALCSSPGNATAESLEMLYILTANMTFRSLAVLFQKDGFFYWVSNHRKNHGNEGNFVMTQLSAASQPIESHVAVRAESEQTRKHWSSLTTSDPGWFILEEAQRGVWMVCMCVCVCGYVGMWFCVLLCNRNLRVRGVLRKDLTGILCRRWSRLSLGIWEISLKRENLSCHRQLAPFRRINLSCLPNMFWHFTKSPFRKQSNSAFSFFKFGEKAFPWEQNEKIRRMQPSLQNNLSVQVLLFS